LILGWLKASHRALDPVRSKPYWPWRPLTRQAQRPVTTGAIEENRIAMLATANLFRRGHGICLEDHEPRPADRHRRRHQRRIRAYHICSSPTVLFYHDRKHPFGPDRER
jgi:uncharacterized protein